MIILIIILMALSPFASAAKLHIDDGKDTAYLPYRYVEDISIIVSRKTGLVNNAMHCDLSPDSNGNYKLITVRNGEGYEGDPAIFTEYHYPNRKVVDDNAVRLTIADNEMSSEIVEGINAVISIGYQKDTAWIVKLYTVPNEIEKRILMIGKDGTGDGKWIPFMRIELFEDYDYDGVKEIFVSIGSGREHTPNYLFCINSENLVIEWMLEVSSKLLSGSLYSCRDSLNPAVIFHTINPMHGYTASIYDDRFRYLSKVNSSGEVVINKIISINANPTRLIRAEQTNQYYMLHSLPMTNPDSIYSYYSQVDPEELESDRNYISKIDNDLNLVSSTTVREIPSFIMLHSLNSETRPRLLVQFTEKYVRSYTTDLEFIAESDPISFYLDIIGTIDIPGHENALILSKGIYTNDFKQLLYFPDNFSKFIQLEPIEKTGGLHLILTNGSKYSIGRIEKKPFRQQLSVFYHNNQIYIMTIISGLFMGLLVMNFYRSKTKRNLVTIRDQKMELDKTYLKLQEAQAKIIAQEKYRQAQDIAGGFAHEIRNALSPARNALSKLIETDSSRSSDPAMTQKLARFSDNAVERALKLTRAISQYTKIEDIHNPEAVDLKNVIEKTLEMNHHRIKSQKVKINVDIDFPAIVTANTDQLQIVFNNLLLNSLDALTDSENADILIETHVDGQNVEVSFRDNGSGIPPDSLERIFDVFYSTKPSGGTGIGLTMVKKIIETYGGSISVDSKLNEFTAVRILLKKYTD
ncbi:MAG: GHKL domain-containing protein [candidate division Zixibacteria bacterium]|nr:GHKL domain-containing protein [candidate division Zixibacteria bacterium]